MGPARMLSMVTAALSGRLYRAPANRFRSRIGLWTATSLSLQPRTYLPQTVASSPTRRQRGIQQGSVQRGDLSAEHPRTGRRTRQVRSFKDASQRMHEISGNRRSFAIG